jgi:hypothetical protein
LQIKEKTMTDKKQDQQTSQVSDQTKPQTDGSKVSTLPQNGSLDEMALDRVSGGLGGVHISGGSIGPGG